ncbi:hypothetical protein PMIN04_004227 [Paraphaeosphaeria minitans]
MEYQYLPNSDGTVIFGTNGELDLSSPTCTIDEGMARYAYVAQVLAAIDERLRKCKPPPMKLPRIQEICRGQDEAKHAARVPEAFQRGFLLKNINTIVGTMEWAVNNLSTPSASICSLTHMINPRFTYPQLRASRAERRHMVLRQRPRPLFQSPHIQYPVQRYRDGLPLGARSSWRC